MKLEYTLLFSLTPFLTNCLPCWYRLKRTSQKLNLAKISNNYRLLRWRWRAKFESRCLFDRGAFLIIFPIGWALVEAEHLFVGGGRFFKDLRLVLYPLLIVLCFVLLGCLGQMSICFLWAT